MTDATANIEEDIFTEEAKLFMRGRQILSNVGRTMHKAVVVTSISAVEAAVLYTVAINLAAIFVPQLRLAKFMASPAAASAVRSMFLLLLALNWRFTPKAPEPLDFETDIADDFLERIQAAKAAKAAQETEEPAAKTVKPEPKAATDKKPARGAQGRSTGGSTARKGAH